ncbi:MAG: hypothetical protein ACP6IP_02620 [Candidatus Njordarchaeia archaeon]
MPRVRGKYLVCVNCRRLYSVKELEEERKARGRDQLVCPFCGSVNFSKEFANVVYIANAEKSMVAEFLKIPHPGIYAYKF